MVSYLKSIGGKLTGQGQAPRAGASPAPTIYGRGRPIQRGEGTGVAVALTSLR